MRITRLSLRNYRVYEDALDLEVPPGLVGIFGPNGAGKSYLVESILWTLFGRSRTTNAEVRTAGVLGDCVTEVEFEHEGHLYLVRRTVAGANATVKAEAHCDRLQVAEGVRDTARYVRSVLGMDEAAFRASVFAEQKQLNAFSQRSPADRQRLVLQLLGITPIDRARDEARKEARDKGRDHERLRAMLPDLDQLRAVAVEARALADAAAAAATTAADQAETARQAAEKAQQVADDLDGRRQEHERVVAEGRAVRATHDAAADRVEALHEELAGLAEAEAELARLRPEAEGLDAAEARLRAVEALAAAEAALAALGEPPPPPPPVEPLVAEAEAARTALDAARSAAAEAEGRLAAATAESDRAWQAVERSEALSGEGDCPLCGQALGEAYEQVQAHRRDELAAAEARVGECTAGRDRARAGLDAAEAGAKEAEAAVAAAQRARTAYERDQARWVDAERRVDEARGGLDPPAEPGEAEGLAAEVARRREAANACQRLAGRLERRAAAARELDDERAKVAQAAGELEALREKVKSLGFRADDLAAATAALGEARAAHDRLAKVAHDAHLAAARAGAEAGAHERRLAEGEAQHARLAGLADDARHLDRFAQLLHDFRTALVATVGPRLSAQAAELFAALTDHEYDHLEVDPETYEIKILDGGVAYGMARFSGSEEDLANLALRVAISEQVRFQSGGQVGLLVLDEPFGPLDPDRKERMLAALHRLQGRFRQVLVVTHDAEVKEQLPSAIAVTPVRRRRASASALTR